MQSGGMGSVHTAQFQERPDYNHACSRQEVMLIEVKVPHIRGPYSI